MIPKKTIIVYMGLQGSGKDLASQITINHYGEPYAERHAFADPLRDTCWNLFRNKLKNSARIYGNAEMKMEEIEGWEMPEFTCVQLGVPHKTLWSGRRLLQWMGTEVCRQAAGYGDIWVDIAKTKIIESDKKIITITDCRFPNEYEMLAELRQWADVHFVWVDRPSVENTQISNHASEAHIANFERTATLNNGGSIQYFERQVTSFLNSFSV